MGDVTFVPIHSRVILNTRTVYWILSRLNDILWVDRSAAVGPNQVPPPQPSSLDHAIAYLHPLPVIRVMASVLAPFQQMLDPSEASNHHVLVVADWKRISQTPLIWYSGRKILVWRGRMALPNHQFHVRPMVVATRMNDKSACHVSERGHCRREVWNETEWINTLALLAEF